MNAHTGDDQALQQQAPLHDRPAVETQPAQIQTIQVSHAGQSQYHPDVRQPQYQFPPLMINGAPSYPPALLQTGFYANHASAPFHWNCPPGAPATTLPTGWPTNVGRAETTPTSIRAEAPPRGITPSNDHDLVVAGSIAIRQRTQGGDGAPTRKDALDALDGTQGHSAAEWKDYYLNRMEQIDAIIRATTAPLPRPVTPQPATSEVTEPGLMQVAENTTACTTGMRIRIPSAKKVQATQEVIEIADSPQKPASKPRKASATKSARRAKTQKVPAPGPPKVSYSDRNKSVTVGDLDDVAQWIVSHGDAWSTMKGSERWKTYASKNKKRSYSGWMNVSKYYEKDIATRVAALRKDKTDEP